MRSSKNQLNTIIVILIGIVLMLVLWHTANGEQPTGSYYKSGAIYDQYGKNIGRYVDRSSIGSTVQEYHMRGGKVYTQRTYNTPKPAGTTYGKVSPNYSTRRK